MADGIWLEVSRVQIAGSKVEVQVVGDKRDNDRPYWWHVIDDPMGAGLGQPTFNAIARGLDRSQQRVIAQLGVDPGRKVKTELDLVCKAIRIQTK